MGSSFVRRGGHVMRPRRVGVGEGHQERWREMAGWAGGRRIKVCLVSYGAWT